MDTWGAESVTWASKPWGAGCAALTNPQGVGTAGHRHKPHRKQHQRCGDSGHLLGILMEPAAGLGMT